MNEQDTPIPPQDDAPIEAMPVEKPRRAASLTLRQEDTREARVASMDAANKSLADALKIAYGGLRFAMVVLLLIFVFSGYQQVNQSERGLRTRFGAVTGPVVQPGPHLSFPKGFGEIERVSLNQQQAQVARAFMPNRFNPGRDVDGQNISTPNLTPGSDGSLITGDGLLVHAQADYTYRRATEALDIIPYLENVHPEFESDMVDAMVRRAMVIAFATTSTDDVLLRAGIATTSAEADAAAEAQQPEQPSPDTPAGSPAEPAGDDPASDLVGQPAVPAAAAGSLDGRVLRLVRDQIQEAGYGMTMDSVSIGLVTPPIPLRDDFRRVLEAENAARTQRSRAEEEARARINTTAGSAALPILALADEYERLLDLGQEEEAEAVIQEIFAVLDGERDGSNVEILGVVYPTLTVGGVAAETVGRARRESQTLGAIAKREADSFRVKVEQYRANPGAFLAREWAEAFAGFLDNGTVSTFMVPDAMQVLRLRLNNDPDIARQVQRDLLRQRLRDNRRLQDALGDRDVMRDLGEGEN